MVSLTTPESALGMRARLTLDGSAELATNCFFIGNGSHADVLWTREDFGTICGRMLNGNAPNNFLMAYRDKGGAPKYARSYRADARERTAWAWDSITGHAKDKTGIGFYPRDKYGNTCWGAIDCDAHNAKDRKRARDLAIKAFKLLVRHPTLWLVLGTSGDSGGWHLFIFSEEPYPCEEWARLLREVADKIGTPIKKGVLEIFPSDSRGGLGIRAPGSWNPKDDSFGLIAFDSATPRLPRLPKEVFSLDARATTREEKISLRIGRKAGEAHLGLYRGEFDGWPTTFAITAPRTRHGKLAELVGMAFPQASEDVARRNAELQHGEASPAPATALSEHLSEV